MKSRQVAAFVVGALSIAGAQAHAQTPTGIAVSVTVTGCPERALVEEALARRGFGPSLAEGSYRLELFSAGATLDVTLRDDDGEVLLDRTLPAGDDCGALADAVAMLVDRRLEGVAWRAPALPPPLSPPPAPAPAPTPTGPRARVSRAAVDLRRAVRARPGWSADLSAGVLYGTGFREVAGTPGPVLALGLRPPEPFAAQLSVAYLPREVIDLPTGSVRIDRVPIALSGAWSLRRQELELDLGLCAEVETVSASARGIPDPASTTRLALRAGPTGSLGVSLGSPVRLAVRAAAMGVIWGWDFTVGETGDGRGKTRVASQVLAAEASVALAWRFGP